MRATWYKRNRPAKGALVVCEKNAQKLGFDWFATIVRALPNFGSNILDSPNRSLARARYN